MIAFQMTHNYVFRHIQTSAATNKLSSCYPVITKRMTHNFFLPQKGPLTMRGTLQKKLDNTNKMCFTTFLLLQMILLTFDTRPFELQFCTLSSNVPPKAASS